MTSSLSPRLCLLLLALPIIGSLLPATWSIRWDQLTLAAVGPLLVVVIAATGPGRDAPRRSVLTAALGLVVVGIAAMLVPWLRLKNAASPADLAPPLWGVVGIGALAGRAALGRWGAFLAPVLALVFVGAPTALRDCPLCLHVGERALVVVLAGSFVWLHALISPLRTTRFRIVTLVAAPVVLAFVAPYAGHVASDLRLHAAPQQVVLMDASDEGDTLVLVATRREYAPLGVAWIRHDGRTERADAWTTYFADAGPHGAYGLEHVPYPGALTVEWRVRFADGRAPTCKGDDLDPFIWRPDGQAAFFRVGEEFWLDDGSCHVLSDATDAAFLGDLPAWIARGQVFVDGLDLGVLPGGVVEKWDRWFIAGKQGLLVFTRYPATNPTVEPARASLVRVTASGLTPLADVVSDQLYFDGYAACAGDPSAWTCWSPDDDAPTSRVGEGPAPVYWSDVEFVRPLPDWGALRPDGHRRDLRGRGYYDLAPDGTISAWRWGIPDDEQVRFTGTLPVFEEPSIYVSF